MTRAFRIALVASLVGPSVCTAAPDWSIEPAQSRLGFQVNQGGGIVEGSFLRFDTAIAFDPKDLATSQVRVSIDITSITTGVAERDRELPKPEWFDFARFPRATFTSDRFRVAGDNKFVAEGTLALRDVKVPVLLPFSLDLQADGTAIVEGKVDLDRTAFGIGQGAWATTDMVGRTVTVIVRLKARRSG